MISTEYICQMLLYKFRSFDNLEHILDIVLHERLYCAPYHRLNDPFEGLFNEFTSSSNNYLSGFPPSEQTLVEVGRSHYSGAGTKVASLSADTRDVRLWSHYANGHTGVAIELEIDSELVREVRYHDALYVPQGLLGPIFSHPLENKTVHWAYEKEYRYITNDDYFHIPGGVIRVLTGIRTSPEHKKLLRRVIPESIPIMQTQIEPKSVEIIEFEQYILPVN